MEAFERGEFPVLVSMQKLTTGYDFPAIDLIGDLQPNNSPGLFVQKAGRGTRFSPGKINCRYLDFAGNIERNGPINDPIKPKKPGERSSVPPIKICGKCGAYNHASSRICGGKDWQKTGEGCGHEFPPPDVEEKLRQQASEAAIMREGPKKVFDWVPVHRVLYSKFQSTRTGKPPSLKVRYISGVKQYDELVRLEHGAALTKQAQTWWHRRATEPMPTSTDAALAYAPQLAIPKRIMIETSGKYPEVVDYEF